MEWVLGIMLVIGVGVLVTWFMATDLGQAGCLLAMGLCMMFMLGLIVLFAVGLFCFGCMAVLA